MSSGHEIPRRILGMTGAEVSIIGVGGFHLGFPTQEEAVRIVRAAVDAGVNFMDNNWGYHQGMSEERMGRALADGYRDRVFLMTKTDARDRVEALCQLDESLKRLKTDHLDLWQLHEVVYDNDPYLAGAPGGALEAMVEAKQRGKVRFLGFTGHKDPALHLRMLDLFPFEAMQIPLNVMDAHFRSFERQVLPVALARNVGIIGMKAFGDPCIVAGGMVTPHEALSYSLSLPAATVVTGIDSMAVLQQNLEIARGFQPLSAEAVTAILQKTASPTVSGDGRYELYKISMKHDADPGRRTHGMPLQKEMPL
ncbi:MAG: aldo/keto reductase [Armatimonadota bacterium]